jgi:hypothetical protein
MKDDIAAHPRRRFPGARGRAFQRTHRPSLQRPGGHNLPYGNEPRILFIDIETKLAEVYSFGIRDQHLTHKQVKTHGGISVSG